jgi:hypothetical protein
MLREIPPFAPKGLCWLFPFEAQRAVEVREWSRPAVFVLTGAAVLTPW